MSKLRALIQKLRDDRGNLTIVIGVTLLSMIIGTLLTMNTATAAALMKSGETTAAIRSSIEDTKELAYMRLVDGQASAVGVTSEHDGARAYVAAQTVNPENSSITLTIVGESMSDNVNVVTVEETFTKFQANFFAGYDNQDSPFWIAAPGSGPVAHPLYTGYLKGLK